MKTEFEPEAIIKLIKVVSYDFLFETGSEYNNNNNNNLASFIHLLIF